jgi:tyrosine-protein phosphatase YwqE
MVELQRSLANHVKELQEALSQVKQLQGILPICAHCKKIRDDQNSWQKVEEYVSEHSEAQFSHSICPDCYASIVESELEELKRRRDIAR